MLEAESSNKGKSLGKKAERRIERNKKSEMKMMQDEIRKGPWTEQEDLHLISFVHLFGDRRWDFIAKVSGLNRTGKSCRLRWVNYLHPGLKRGKMTPQEEKLVLELHEKWGNRWSRIARRLPGRTDNEIKNYWRTHMRKKAQQKKRDISPSSSSSTNSCSESNITTTENSSPFPEPEGATFYDTGGRPDTESSAAKIGTTEAVQGGGGGGGEKGYSMEDIWKDIENSIEPVGDGFSEEGCNNFSCPSIASPVWDYCSDTTLWKMDEEDGKMFHPYEYGTVFLTG